MSLIRFPSNIGERIGDISSVEVTAPTLRSALAAFTRRYPEVDRIIWRDGELNPAVAVFLNDQIVVGSELDCPIAVDAEIDILLAVSGG